MGMGLHFCGLRPQRSSAINSYLSVVLETNTQISTLWVIRFSGGTFSANQSSMASCYMYCVLLDLKKKHFPSTIHCSRRQKHLLSLSFNPVSGRLKEDERLWNLGLNGNVSKAFFSSLKTPMHEGMLSTIMEARKRCRFFQ